MSKTKRKGKYIEFYINEDDTDVSTILQNLKEPKSEYIKRLIREDHNPDKAKSKDNKEIMDLSILELYDHMLNINPNIFDNICRLYSNLKIPKEIFAKYITVIKCIYIQIQNTEKFCKIYNDYEIESKRDTTNKVFINESTGHLVNKLLDPEKFASILNDFEEKQEEQKKIEKMNDESKPFIRKLTSKQKEEIEQKFQEWNRKYNGRYPRSFMYQYKPEDYEKELKAFNEQLIDDKELERLVKEEEYKREELLPSSNITRDPMEQENRWTFTDEEIQNLISTL